MHHLRSPRGIASLSVAVLALLGSACGGGDDADEAASTTTEAPTTTEATTTTTEAPDDDASDDDGAAAAGEAPSWAYPYETPGELITTIEGEDFEVEVYQVGVTQATKTGGFVDPDTNQPLIAEGDDIVFVNYVITNTSGETIPLAFNLVSVTPKYEDWPYLQGMDSIADRALYEEMKVVSSVLNGTGDAPFEWEAGASFSYGTNFKHQPGSPITFSATLTPATPDGELDHDNRQEASADATIS